MPSWKRIVDIRKVIHDLEREASYQNLKVVEQLEKQLCKQSDDAVFAKWITPYEQFENRLAQIDQLSFWYGCFWDAVELVDWRNGEIRNRAINQWLAEETLKGMMSGRQSVA